MDPSDSEVISESLSGHPEVFAQVVRRHSNVVHGYLARRTGRETADELLGEVWLRAFRSRHTYDQAFPDARPWLYGIARNTLRAHWQIKRIDDVRDAEPIDDPWPDVDARLDASEQAQPLRAALGTLDPDDREVLLLVAWEHLTPAEIAASLGMPGGTVRWRLHRARKQLQDQLDGSPTVRRLNTQSKEA